MFQVLTVTVQVKYQQTVKAHFSLQPLVALNRLCRFTEMPRCTFCNLLVINFVNNDNFLTLTYQSKLTCCFMSSYMHVVFTVTSPCATATNNFLLKLYF